MIGTVFNLLNVRQRLAAARDYHFAHCAGDLQLFRHRDADTFIVSYPKSGRSWLRVMMAHYFCQVHDRSFDVDADITELTRQFPDSPRISFVHDGSTHEGECHYTAAELSGDKRFYRGRRVVLLVRDLRDVMVSYYMHATRRQRVFDGTLSEYIRDDRFGIAKAVAFLNHWYNARHVPGSLMVVRYEDLMRNPAGELLRLVQFIGMPVDHDAANASAEFACFDNMKTLERSGMLVAGGKFGPGAGNDENSFKVRKGCIAGFIDDLSPDDLRYLSDYIDQYLSPFYGYTSLWRQQLGHHCAQSQAA
jgi:hypothetical protein